MQKVSIAISALLLAGRILGGGSLPSAEASPVPNFMVPNMAGPGTPIPGKPPVTPTRAPADMTGVPAFNPSDLGMLQKSGSMDPSSPKLDPTKGILNRFSGPTSTDSHFMSELIKLREAVILDTLRRRKHVLEEGLKAKDFEVTPAGVHAKRVTVVAVPKKKVDLTHGIQVLAIHDDRVFVAFGGHSSWITLGGSVGPYRLKSVTEDSATFADNLDHSFTLKRAPKVVPRPALAVISVNGQTATIKYNNDNYTVTLNSPVGADLTVTALSDTNFSVTDGHGRVFSYPVPQKGPLQAGAPGMFPGGYQPPPPPSPYPPRQGSNSGSSAAEDSNY